MDVRLTRQAGKDVDRLPEVRPQLMKRLRELEPEGAAEQLGKHLSHRELRCFRRLQFHGLAYRIVYKVRESDVVVVAVAHRTTVYETLTKRMPVAMPLPLEGNGARGETAL